MSFLQTLIAAIYLHGDAGKDGCSALFKELKVVLSSFPKGSTKDLPTSCVCAYLRF